MRLHFSSLRSPRFLLIAALTFIITILAVWWGLWLVAAAQYQNVIDTWINDGRKNGYTITYDSRELFGFPRHLVLRFKNVLWHNTDDIIFRADNMDIGATPWQWQKFTAKFKNHADLTAPLGDEGNALTLSGNGGQADIELDPQGYWLSSRIALQQAKLGQAPNYVVTADNLNVFAERPTHMPKDHTEAGLTLKSDGDHVILPDSIPSPFGNQMKTLKLDLRVMGMVPDFRKRESVAAWNQASGIVEIDSLQMDWGPLNIKTKGTMGFDDDLQPEGAFIGALGDHEAVLKALMDGGYIEKRQENMMTSALSLFAKPSRFSSNLGIELPIAVQLGGLFLGPVKIFAFPQIQWPGAPQTGNTPEQQPAPSSDTPPATTP